MAPRKRKAEEGEEAPVEKPVMTSTRTTRSATRRANVQLNKSASELAKVESPKNKAKKAKPAPKRKKETVKAVENDSEKEKSEEGDGGDESEKRTIVIEHCLKAAIWPFSERRGNYPARVGKSGTRKEFGVIYETFWKSDALVINNCNSFKTRANIVKDGLEKDVAGIKVLLNPEKPRRGCFEIREKGGETFISLLDMKRPFKPMKDLSMDKVISDIVEKLK